MKGIDDNLQRLLDYLKQDGLLDNTMVVYTSDQGMMLGEHDYIDKRWMYEESIRMPLIVHWPRGVKTRGRCGWLINNTDFAPTLLDVAGVPTPNYMQGKSFLAALRGQIASQQQHAVPTRSMIGHGLTSRSLFTGGGSGGQRPSS